MLCDRRVSYWWMFHVALFWVKCALLVAAKKKYNETLITQIPVLCPMPSMPHLVAAKNGIQRNTNKPNTSPKSNIWHSLYSFCCQPSFPCMRINYESNFCQQNKNGSVFTIFIIIIFVILVFKTNISFLYQPVHDSPITGIESPPVLPSVENKKLFYFIEFC